MKGTNPGAANSIPACAEPNEFNPRHRRHKPIQSPPAPSQTDSIPACAESNGFNPRLRRLKRIQSPTSRTFANSIPACADSIPACADSIPWHRLLTIPPAWVARAVRFVLAEQHLGGPLVGGAVALLSLIAAALAMASAPVAWFFYSGTAGDLAMWALIAVIARFVWLMGYCR